MYNTDYLQLMRELRLSTHPHQLIRRLTKYPAHIKHINGTWRVTDAYAALLKGFTCINQKQKEVQYGSL